MTTSRVAFAAALLSLFAIGAAEGQGALLDRALDELWRERELSDREKRAADVLRLEAPFDTLFTALEAGPRYTKDVKTGLVEESRKGANGLRQEYVFLVPENYDPEKRYRVCFYLHGGIHRTEAWKKGDPWWRRFDRFDGREQISVFPSSWRGSLWWQSSQIENLAAILARIKSEYNVDENRVYLFGVSDGGTGVYYHAAKAPTLWAAFFPFIGHPGVLDNPAAGVDGEIHARNLVNRAFYIVNGEKDRLYPVARVAPYVEDFERAGVELVFRPQPGGHNTRWWNGERDAIEAFIAEHPRVPLPDRLLWTTERTDRFSRLHWLVVEELEGEAGTIEVQRRGNAIDVAAEGIRRYKLLLSPRQFDFAVPIEVVTNGVSSFRGTVERSSETLLAWAARDLDRTMLFGAEISVSTSP